MIYVLYAITGAMLFSTGLTAGLLLHRKTEDPPKQVAMDPGDRPYLDLNRQYLNMMNYTGARQYEE